MFYQSNRKQWNAYGNAFSTWPQPRTSPILEQRLYTVHLGNRVKVLFTSLRQAKAFQAETDRWINLHLSDCNFLLVDAFAAYRHAWPLMDKAAMERVEHRSRELIENAWRGMDMALATGSGTNGWVMAWKHLEGAVECINRLALLLRDLYLSRNQPVERDRMELLLKRVNAIKTDMAHYGKQVKGADVIHVL